MYCTKDSQAHEHWAPWGHPEDGDKDEGCSLRGLWGKASPVSLGRLEYVYHMYRFPRSCKDLNNYGLGITFSIEMLK